METFDLLFQEWDLKKMSRGDGKSKVVYDERVFANGGTAANVADSETEEEYFKRMHEFNKATGASGIFIKVEFFIVYVIIN